jgi:arginine decarboxylase
MRQLTEAIDKSGFRTVTGLSYEDARRLVNVFNSESCWVISVDGEESTKEQWDILEGLLAAKRSRNNKLPIFKSLFFNVLQFVN